MEPLNIILDSNIYWSDRNFRKKDFLLLKGLINHNLIQLHIPSVVKEECLTTNSIEISEDFSKIKSIIKKLKDKGLHKNEIDRLGFFLEQIEEFVEDVNESANSNWEEFIRNSNSIVHEIKKEHGVKVITDYFSGEAPFKHRKNREDFPDAFIYQSIIDINESYNNLIFVSRDKNLRMHVEKNIKLYSFSSFYDFYKSKVCEPYKEEYEDILSIRDESLELKESKDELIRNFERYLYDDFYHISFQDLDDTYDNDQSETEIQGVEKVNSIELVEEDIEFIEDRIHLAFNVELDALVEYYIYKNEYISLPEERTREIGVTDWNRHVFLAEESMTLDMKINCSILRGNLEEPEFEINDSVIRYE